MLIECDGLSCVRGDAALFQALSFDLEPGGALLVRGANGVGKTSLLRMLPGFLRPSAGTILIDGETPADRADRIHFVGHSDGLKASQSARQHLSFWSNLLNGPGNVDEALAIWGLTAIANLPCGVLSAGQRRRLVLARLLVAERDLWVLDEPTAPLDRAASKIFIDQVATYRSKGGIVAVATHLDLAIGNALEIRLGEGVQI